MDTRWDELVEVVAGGEVTAGQMFGSPGLRTGQRYFALYWHDKLVLKLPPDRIAELRGDGEVEPFEPMPGRPMGGWVLVEDDADWAGLAEEAHEFVAVAGRD